MQSTLSDQMSKISLEDELVLVASNRIGPLCLVYVDNQLIAQINTKKGTIEVVQKQVTEIVSVISFITLIHRHTLTWMKSSK